MTSFRDFIGKNSWNSRWTSAPGSGCLFSNFFDEFPGPPKIQAVFLQLSDEQRRADLDRPTPCRQIQKRGSAPPDPGPVFSQPSALQSVVEIDRPTLSCINTVRHKKEFLTQDIGSPLPSSTIRRHLAVSRRRWPSPRERGAAER